MPTRERAAKARLRASVPPAIASAPYPMELRQGLDLPASAPALALVTMPPAVPDALVPSRLTVTVTPAVAAAMMDALAWLRANPKWVSTLELFLGKFQPLRDGPLTQLLHALVRNP